MRFLIVAMIAALPALADEKQDGKASFYHDMFEGRTTASGEPFKQDENTAASRTLPLGSKATVTNKETGQSTEVEINDRGPYKGQGRIIDNAYRVPWRLIGGRVTVPVSGGWLRISHCGSEVAAHAETAGRRQRVI